MKDLRPSFLPVLVALLTGAFALSLGCVSMPKDRVILENLERCPEMSLEGLLQKARTFNQSTETATLQCALGTLREHELDQGVDTGSGAIICFLLADREADQTKRRKLAAEGLRFAERAIAADSDGDGALHYYLAVNLGLAVRDTVALALKNLSRLESELIKARELAPQEDQGGPLRVLGMLYLMAPPWPQGLGDGDKALELLVEAVRKYPQHPLNHLFYAQALLQLEEEDAAQEIVTAIKKARELLAAGGYGQANQRWKQDLDALEKNLGSSPNR